MFSRVKSGGIILGFNKNIADFIVPIETDNYIYWFKVKKNRFFV